jgi:tripartite-type tricarboxylate transporter receptor subunit TctC
VLARLNSEVRSALRDPAVRAAFAKVGVEPSGTSVEEGASFVRDEFQKWAAVVRDGQLKGR